MRYTATTLILALLVAGCTTTLPVVPAENTPTVSSPTVSSPAPSSPTASPGTPPAQGEDALAGSQWELQSYGPADAAVTVVGEQPVTLEFSSDGQVGGNAGCNSYGGSYQAQEGALVFSQVVSTLVACVDDAIMEQERAYLDALQTVSAYQIEGDQLTLTYEGGELIYQRATAAPAPGEPAATDTPAPEAAAPDAPPTRLPRSTMFGWDVPGERLWAQMGEALQSGARPS